MAERVTTFRPYIRYSICYETEAHCPVCGVNYSMKDFDSLEKMTKEIEEYYRNPQEWLCCDCLEECNAKDKHTCKSKAHK